MTNFPSVRESIAYINEVFGDYKQYSGIERFYGRVAEVGPGDSCGVGLLFLADGCEEADLADRFRVSRDTHQSAIYHELVELHPSLRDRCTKTPPDDETAFDGIHYYYGDEASVERFFSNHGPYDFIVSRATLEHVVDPIAAITSMAKALNPNGMLLHKVDLRDHGMLFDSFHELKFLEIPDWIYRYMSSGSGRPNRILLNRYREALQKQQLEVSIFITRLAGVGDISPHLRYEQIAQELRQKSLAYIRSVRPRFARSFRSVSDEDLSIGGFFLVARKR